MEDYLKVLALAALPAAGNFAGGLMAEMFKVSQKSLSFALHAAAGIILAVVGIELMPQALETTRPWIPILAFLAGGAFFILLDNLIEVVQSRVGNPKSGTGPWAIFFGVSVDLFSDGVMIGTGSTIGFSLALLLAVGQVPADIPEGFATIANFTNAGVARKKRILLSAAFAIPIFLGASIGYWGLKTAPEIVKLSLLAFTAGILVTVAVEEMVPEAHKEKDARLASMFLVGGFALFAFLSTLLEG